MDIMHIITQMLIIFGVVLVGFFSAKRKLWNFDLDRNLSVFILSVSMPALIIASVMGKGLTFDGTEITTLLLVSLVSYAVLFGFAFIIPLIWKVEKEKVEPLRFMLAFGNVCFIGYPLCEAVFGPRALFYASVLNIPFNFLVYTFGISFINGGSAKSALSTKLILSPCIIASVIAIILAAFKVQTPEPIAKWFHTIGDITTPCALLIVGSCLSRFPKHDIRGNSFIYTVTFLRLIALPLTVGVILAFMNVDKLICDVAITLCAMPIATNGVLFCLKYNKDERTMTQALFFTTVGSLITLPTIAFIASLF